MRNGTPAFFECTEMFIIHNQCFSAISSHRRYYKLYRLAGLQCVEIPLYAAVYKVVFSGEAQ